MDDQPEHYSTTYNSSKEPLRTSPPATVIETLELHITVVLITEMQVHLSSNLTNYLKSKDADAPLDITLTQLLCIH